MRIETKNFKKYFIVLSEFYNKGLGDEKTEGIYLDFKTGNAYVQNNSSGICGKVKFGFELDEGDQIENFIINTRKFLNIAQNSDFILLDNDKVFHTDGSSYKLHTLIDDVPETLSLFDQTIQFDNTIVFDSVKLEELKRATKYLYKKLDFPYRAIYIQNGFMSALLVDQIFEAKFDCDPPCEESISIYNDFSVFINMLDDDITLFVSENFMKLEDTNGDISLIMPKINLLLPEIHTEKFIEQYNASQVLEFKVDELALGLAILSPYYKNSKLKKIALIVNPDLPNKILFKFDEEGEVIEREVEYINKEEIDSLTIYFDGDSLKKAIDTLGGNIIRIAINNSNSKDSSMYLKSDLNDDRKVLLSLLQNNF